MRLQGYIGQSQRGLNKSIGAMHMQLELMGVAQENINGFDKVGYQRKDGVVSSFAEYIGVHGLSRAVDDSTGRIARTDKPLDFAIGQKGYFQLLNDSGAVELSRDGRFKINEKGELLGLENQKVLTQGGTPVVLPFFPEKQEDIRVDTNGRLSIFNPETRKMEFVDTLGVVSSEGAAVLEPDIKQGCLEFSNVSMAQEFLEMIPLRRNFDANRQLFMIQNNALSKAIQQIGGS